MRRWLALGALVWGCGAGGAPSAGDASVEAGVVIGPPAAPASPEAPRMTCAPGWRASIDAGVSICEPWIEDAAPRCGASEIASVGGPSDCLPALACPAGDWPDDVPTDAVYVRAGAVGGDGSRAAPFATLAQALARAASTGTVVLGAGEYAEWARVDGTPTIRGVCPERVRVIDPATPAQAAIVVNARAHPRISGLTLTGASHALWLLEGASASIDGVVLRAPQPILLEADATLDASAARIDATSTARSAIVAFPGASVSLAHAHVSGGDAGVRAAPARGATGGGDATIAITDSAILDTHDALFGGVSGTLERVAIERVASGLLVLPGHELSLTDVRARGIHGDAGFLGVFGTVHLRRVAIATIDGTTTSAAAIAVSRIDGAAVHLDGSDVALVHGANVALSIGDSDAVVLDHVALVDVAGGLDQRGGAVTLSDVRIDSHGPAGADPERPGHDVSVAGGTLALDRAQLTLTEAGRPAALLVQSPGVVVAHDVATHGGIGMVAQCEGAGCDRSLVTLDVTRASVQSAREFGVEVLGARAAIADLSVDGVAFADGVVPGLGVVAAADGTIDLTRADVRGVEGAGLAALQNGVLRGAGITSVGSSAVVRTGEAERHWGDGLVCGSSGSMSLDAIDVRSAERAGLVVSFDCAPSRWTGTITGCAIGVLTDEHPAAATDFSGIVLSDDGVSYDSLTLAIPVVDPSF